MTKPVDVVPVATTDDLGQLQKECRSVYVDPSLITYAVKLVAATRDRAELYLPLLKRRQVDPEQPTLVLLDREIMQVVTVPVRAPMTIGHVLMGFRLDEVPLLDLKRLINVDAMFVIGERGRWQDSVSIAEDGERGPAFFAAMADLAPGQSLRREWGGQHWRVRLIPLLRDRVRGVSKMHPNIISEALWLVTRWGVRDRVRRLRRMH